MSVTVTPRARVTVCSVHSYHKVCTVYSEWLVPAVKVTGLLLKEAKVTRESSVSN